MDRSLNRWIAEFGRYLDKHPIAAWGFSGIWILLIGGIAFLWNLGSIGLVDETEPLFVEAARQMTVTGDWITPYFNGETRFDKPPLIYWLMAIAYKILGVNEWAARLPSALAAIALMAVGFYTLQRYSHPASGQVSARRWLAAWIGSAIMALTPLMVVWGRTGVSDMLLTSCVGLALLTFFCGYVEADKGRKREGEAGREGGDRLSSPASLAPLSPPASLSPWYLAFYLFIALGILTKGPVGFVLPGLIIAMFLLYVGRLWVVLREMRPLVGCLIILVLALPWYGLVTLANGEAFINSFFVYHNVERFTSVVNRHRAPWYFYFLVVLWGFAPWSLYLPVAIARLKFWQRSRWRKQPRSSHLALFALVWFVGVFGFFTVSVTKLPSYVIPLMPAAAILVGIFWSELMTPEAAYPANLEQIPQAETAPLTDLDRAKVRQNLPVSGWGVKLSVLLNGLGFLVFAGITPLAPQWLEADKSQPLLPKLLEQAGVFSWSGAIAATIAMGCLGLLVCRQLRWAWLVNLLGFLALFAIVLMPALFIVDSQRQLPLRQLSDVAVQRQRPGEEIVMVGYKMPSVVFYTRQHVTFGGDGKQFLNYLNEKVPNGASIMVLANVNDLNSVQLPYPTEPFAQASYYRLLRVTKTLPSPPGTAR